MSTRTTNDINRENHDGTTSEILWIKKEIDDSDGDDDEMLCPITALKENHSRYLPVTIEIPLTEEIVDTVHIKKEEISDSEDDMPISRLNNIKPSTSIFGSDDDSDVPLNSIRRARTKEIDDEDYMACENGESSDSEVLARKTNKKKKITIISGYVCHICGIDRKNKKQLKQHMHTKHGEKYTCQYCEQEFDDRENYIEHRKTHTGDTPYLCNMCPAEKQSQFATKNKLKLHNLSVHGFEQPFTPQAQWKFKCHLCNKCLKSQGTLSDHMKLHIDEKTVTCKVCDKEFARDRDLKLHMNLHNESWKCNVCDRCFVTSCKLKEHFRKHSGERPFECTKCDRSFVRASDFRYHVGTHLGLKPFACDICDLRFTTSSSVTRHKLNMHATTPRDFGCTICDKTFFTEGRLRTHIKNHNRSKHVSCEQCPVKFVSQTELRRHMKRRHLGRYPCDICETVCETPQQFEIHKERHNLKGKPYTCNACSFGYKSYQGLSRHLSTAHKDEDVPKMPPQHLCGLCGQVFEIKDKLNRHLKDEHIVLVVGELEVLDEMDPDDQNGNGDLRIPAPEMVNIKTEPPDDGPSTPKDDDKSSSQFDDI